ncbi:MAG: acetyltransferase [Ruminococcus sp.]|nr:acetyltransferase [Ruminococcus sp.]
MSNRSSNYSIFETIKNIIFVINTKLFYRKGRMVRLPITIRGKKYIDFGENITTGYRCRFDALGVHSKKIIRFGKNVNIGDNTRISACSGVYIGNNVLIGSRVLIIDNCHGTYRGQKQDSPYLSPNLREISASRVNIEDNVWIGDGAVIQMGVHIGFGSIIGANSIVTKDVPPKSIVCGTPAKVIKTFNSNTQTWEKVNL